MNRTLLLCLLAAIVSHADLSGQDAAPVPQQKPLDAQPEQVAAKPPTKAEAKQAVRRNRHRRHNSREIVAIGNDARVQEGEEFDEVVVVHGNALINGTVDGEVVVVLGKLRLGPTAIVDGDVTVVAGALEADPAAQIAGSPRVIGPDLFGLRQGFERGVWWVRWPGEWFSYGLLHGRALPLQFSWSWLLAGLALLLYLLVALLFPRSVQNTVGLLDASPGRALGAGLLGLVALPALILLLVLTGIGVLILPFVFVGFATATVFGKVAVYRYAGQQVGTALGLGALQKPLLALVVGALGFYLLYAIPLVGLIIWAAALVLGFGAVLLATFKREPKVTAGSQAVPLTIPPLAASAETAAAALPAENAALLPHAGFWIRLFATLLDAILVGLIIGPLLRLHEWFLLVWVAYHIAFWSWKGTTVGGIIVGLKIVRTDGRPINFAVALVRCLASFFSLAVLGLGFLWAGWSQEKQSWHDQIAGTLIVKAPKGTPLV
jgi:uncharacterized RDD family membrane protein YckC